MEVHQFYRFPQKFMINSHQFQQAAKQFRAGRISLKEFTDLVIEGTPSRKPNEQDKKSSIEKTKSSASMVTTNLPKLQLRKADSHKGDYGKIVGIGGAQGMAGAIALSGCSALRSGAGLVKLLIPDVVQATVSNFNPCLMTVACDSEEGCLGRVSLAEITEQTKWADVVALGPGMGRTKSLQSIVKTLYESLPQPMVVDADGLNNLVDGQTELSQHAGPRVLTPHPGEFERLAAAKFSNRQEMESAAMGLAEATKAIVVLKGSRTLVTNGKTIFENETGNAGMATAGSGDVLTGIIAGLIGQNLSPFEAAALGVHLHGIAGDFAAEANGEISMIASDLIDCLPAAFKKHANESCAPIGFQTAAN